MRMKVLLHPLDPYDEDQFLPFLNLKLVHLLPLEVYLPFTHRAALACVECRRGWVTSSEWPGQVSAERGVECDELVEGRAGLHMCGDMVVLVAIRLRLFERFEFLLASGLT